MSKRGIFRKTSGVWKEIYDFEIHNAGVWQHVKGAYVKQNDTWRLIYPTTGTINYTKGRSTFQVPPGIFSITVKAAGGSGGGGGADTYGGNAGGVAQYVSGVVQVHPGDVITVDVGGGGQGGATDVSGVGAGPGGSSMLGYYGGRGGNAGSSGWSGSGGGGGAATVFAKEDNTLILVAGGGAGGGGGGNYGSGGGGFATRPYTYSDFSSQYGFALNDVTAVATFYTTSGLYHGYYGLNRKPDTNGLLYWLNRFNIIGGNLEQLAQEIHAAAVAEGSGNDYINATQGPSAGLPFNNGSYSGDLADKPDIQTSFSLAAGSSTSGSVHGGNGTDCGGNDGGGGGGGGGGYAGGGGGGTYFEGGGLNGNGGTSYTILGLTVTTDPKGAGGLGIGPRYNNYGAGYAPGVVGGAGTDGYATISW
jgi:hypothetical protein